MSPSRERTLAAVGLGVAFDLALNRQAPGVSVPILVTVAAATVWWTSPRTNERTALLAAAVALSPIVALRAEDAIVGPTLLAIVALLALAATGPGVAHLTMRSAVGRGVGVLRSLLRSPEFVAAPVFRAVPAGARLRRIARTAAIAVPVVAVFTILFASADQVFADALVPDASFLFGDLFGHVVLVLIGIWLAGAWWPAEHVAAASTPAGRAREPRLTPAEWTVVLAALVALFAVFVVVQFAVLFGGRGRVEVTPGLTYAEYARSGFFQLLAVGGLTAAVVLGLWDHGRHEQATHRRRFLALCAALTGLCLIVLVSAAVRLSLYQQQFGFTIARLAAWFAIVATGVALCGLLAAIAARQRHRVLSGALAIVLACLLAAAVISPSRLVAQRNTERFASTGKIDLDYLVTLGPEAAPVLAGLLPALDETRRTLLHEILCFAEWHDAPRGWRSWNLARSRAYTATQAIGCATASG